MEAPVAMDPYSPESAPVTDRPPRWWGNHLGELRWQAELARLLIDPVYRGVDVPRGDGRAVLVMPGLFAGDQTLEVLREWLDRMGYDGHVGGFFFNVSCSDTTIDNMERLAEELSERTDGRRIALIGHSRGGHFVKALSRRRPDLIACGISLGAALERPLDISYPTQGAVRATRYLIQRSTGRGCFSTSCDCQYRKDFAAEFPEDVPLTSIYSRGDGVVRWQAARVPFANCVEVTGSHVGLVFNRKVYRAIGDALYAARER